MISGLGCLHSHGWPIRSLGSYNLGSSALLWQCTLCDLIEVLSCTGSGFVRALLDDVGKPRFFVFASSCCCTSEASMPASPHWLQESGG